MRQVEVVYHQVAWQTAFALAAHQIAAALGENVVNIHHIGSTSIPGIYAKPIIDILVEVRDIAAVDQQNAAMERLGYEVKGEFGIAGRRYFRKDNAAGSRTHHIHTFATGSPELTRQLAFRDYLLAHPDEANRYSELKRQLADQYPNDMAWYIDGKNDFIQAIDRKAALWRAPQEQWQGQ